VSASPGPVRVLAQKAMMLVVNTSDSRVDAVVDGQRMTLGPYEVRWVART